MLPPGQHRPVEVLLVEDSPNDAELMVEALAESRLALRVTVIDDGEDALNHLRRAGSAHGTPRPDLILLDLHLPRKSGHEILQEVKKDPALRTIPVIVMTSFDGDEAIRGAYDLHANCCVRKPANLDQFTLAVRKIESFWLQQVRLEHRT